MFLWVFQKVCSVFVLMSIRSISFQFPFQKIAFDCGNCYLFFSPKKWCIKIALSFFFKSQSLVLFIKKIPWIMKCIKNWFVKIYIGFFLLNDVLLPSRPVKVDNNEVKILQKSNYRMQEDRQHTQKSSVENHLHQFGC